MNDLVRVVVVHGDRAVRESIAQAMRGRRGAEAVPELAPEAAVPGEFRGPSPDVVLFYVSTLQPDVTGAILETRKNWPNAKVVIAGVSEEDDSLLEFVEAGVDGYVSNLASLDEILNTVHAVYRGETPCSPRVAASLFRHLARVSAERRRAKWGGPVLLTQRERQVLALMGQGLVNREIAEHLCVEVNTVKNHVHSVLEKLHVQRRQDAVQVALERGLLPTQRGGHVHAVDYVAR